MMENVSQSLAGRTVIFYLLPLSLAELETAGISKKPTRSGFSKASTLVYTTAT